MFFKSSESKNSGLDLNFFKPASTLCMARSGPASERTRRSAQVFSSSIGASSRSSLRVPDLSMSIAGKMEDALVGHRTVEHQLHVARTLELLEDHLVHARAGIDERRRDDRERAAVLDVARRAEEALRAMERERVHAARENLAGMRLDRVVGAREARDRIEQDDHVLAVLRLAARHLDHHLRHVHMVLRLLVERGGKHHRLRVALHVRHFLRTLVHEQHDQHRLGMVRRDGVRHLLKKDRLAHARRRDDESALPEPDGREEIHHAHRVLRRLRLEDDAPRGERGREVLEVDDTRRLARRLAVDGEHVAEREEAVAVARVADRTFDRVARAQRVPADLLLRDEHVLGAGQEVRLRRAQEPVAFLHHLQAAARQHRPAVVQVATDRVEDDLVALHRAQLFRVRVRPHLLHDRGVVPGMDVRQLVFGQIGIARHGRLRRLVVLLLGRRLGRTPVPLHALSAHLVAPLEPLAPLQLAHGERLLGSRGTRRNRRLIVEGL